LLCLCDCSFLNIKGVWRLDSDEKFDECGWVNIWKERLVEAVTPQRRWILKCEVLRVENASGEIGSKGVEVF